MPRTTFSIRFYFTSDIFYFHFYLFYVYTEIIIYKEKPILTLLKFNYVIYEIIKYFSTGKKSGQQPSARFHIPRHVFFFKLPSLLNLLFDPGLFLYLAPSQSTFFQKYGYRSGVFPTHTYFSCTDRAFYVLSIYFLFWSNFYFLILPFYPVWFLEAIFIFKSGISPSKPV